MKAKLFVLAALAVVGLTMEAAPASAWHRSRSVIVCRPYNAFSEGCYGRMSCVGCCPFPGHGHGGGGAAYSPCLGNPMLGMAGYDAGALNAPYAGMMPMPHPGMAAMPQPGMNYPAMNYPGMPVTSPALPQQSAPPSGHHFAPPQPMPSNTQTMAPMGMPIQPVNYQAYYPVYYPLMPINYPGTQQVPSYWYGN